MPFRLTCSGIVDPPCANNSFDLLPGVTEEQISEVSRLIYHCGVAVEMNWQGTGTPNNPGTWASSLSQYFNYTLGWTYYDEMEIASDNEGFKLALRNELQNNHPVLFSYYGTTTGHAVVIDGYENENFFHFACGWGGGGDAFYYLFDLDDDGIHDQTPHHSFYRAAMGIRPNCPTNTNLTVQNSTISSTGNILYDAIGQIDFNNVIILGNGTSGGRVSVSGNEVNLNAGFEVQPGASLFIHPSGCSQP
jgi:hypothetical protein